MCTLTIYKTDCIYLSLYAPLYMSIQINFNIRLQYKNVTERWKLQFPEAYEAKF